MKVALGLAAMALQAVAVIEDAGPWNYSQMDPYLMYSDAAGTVWVLQVQTAMDLDNGKEYLRLYHHLTA